MKRISILIVSAALLVTMTQGAAFASTKTFKDRTGDTKSNVDIRSVSVSNNRRTVSVSVTVKKISAETNGSITIYIDSPAAKGFPNFYFATSLSPYSGDYGFGRTSGWNLRYNQQIDCAVGASQTERTLTVRFPQGCLGDLKKVRVGVATQTYEGTKSTTRDWLIGKHKLTSWVNQS